PVPTLFPYTTLFRSRQQLYAAFLVASLVFLLSVATAAASVPPPAAALLRAMNAARTARGLPPLRLDWTLMRAAGAHSTDRLEHRSEEHTSELQSLAY